MSNAVFNAGSASAKVIANYLTEPPKMVRPVFRWVMLAIILLLLVIHIRWRLTLPPGYRGDRNGNGVIVLAILFNHLAFQFRWPRSVTAVLRVLMWSWLAFTLFYVFYWSHILYP